jgi:eukaryotic-like serine/threonine-protein kinase
MANVSSSSALSPELIALQRAVAGRYSIVRELGRGGTGIVFLARDVALERPVAIKLLPPLLAMNAEDRARFIGEARTAAVLSHPNIVPIHAVEEHDDLAFFVMGFVDGETLTARVSRSGPLRVNEAIRVTQEVAWALADAHGHGLIHRDIKPDNILLERDTGRAIVTDFGITRLESGTSSSSPDAIVGTPQYMSPEQSRGDAVDGRSDLYSLGAVAYFALTGRPPIDGDSAVAILARKEIVNPPPLVSARADLPPRFASRVERCLERNPAERWSSAEEFAAAIRSASSAKEVAPAIRAFLREAEHVGSEVEKAASASAIAVLLALAVRVVRHARHLPFLGDRGIAIILVMYLAVAASTAGLAAVQFARLVSRARRLRKAGYGHSAVRSALLTDAREHDTDRSPPRAWRTWAEIVLGLAGTAGSVVLANAHGIVLPLLGLAGSVAIPTLGVWRVLEARRAQDSWWSRLLCGRFGRALFQVVGLAIWRRPPELPVAGEPTSLVLRTELTALFDRMPSKQRAAFADLPSLAIRLEAQAEALRERTSSPETDRRLQSAVAALELLRLDLRRVKAAAIDPGDLTRDLDEARRVSDDIDARLRANAEVARFVWSDAQQTPTPT